MSALSLTINNSTFALLIKQQYPINTMYFNCFTPIISVYRAKKNLQLVLFSVRTLKNKIMGLSPLFGVAKMLVRSRKLKMAAVGLQLAYLGYTYISDKRKNKQVSK